MSLTLTYTECPTCRGFGVVSDRSSRITCSTCSGKGSWFSTADGKRLAFSFPEVLPTRTNTLTSYTRPLLIFASATAALFSTISAGTVVHHALNQGSLFPYGPPFAAILFGLSGLSLPFTLSMLDRHSGSNRSLVDLATALSALNLDQVLPLEQFANPRVSTVLRQAAVIAGQRHCSHVDESSLLLSILSLPRVRSLLARLEVSSSEVFTTIQNATSQGGEGYQSSVISLPIVRRCVYAAANEAIVQSFPYIDAEDLLLAYTKLDSPLSQLLQEQGISYERVLAVSQWYAHEQERVRQWQFWVERGRTRPKGHMNRAWTALPTPTLDQYGTDLTAAAAHGYGTSGSIHAQQIALSLEVLCRSKKGSVILVGDPGVGKDTTLRAIALRMAMDDVPESLQDHRLVALDLAALVTGGSEAGTNRLQRILNEVEQAGNVILAIADVQTLVGTGGETLDAASLLSNALARGSLQVITSATPGDYHRYVESNATLSAALETVPIPSASVADTVRALEEEAPSIEARQHVVLTYPALVAAAESAARYLADRALPEAAVTVLDAAAAAAQQAKRHWVTRDDILASVEARTGIPIRDADAQERNRLLNFEQLLRERVIGQEQALHAVAAAVRRARSGLHDAKRPLCSFLFVGPTGVGKTETARALALLLFGSEEAMLRFDMSEYQDRRAIYRLIGAPAGDPDAYTEGGTLSQPVRERPYSLILLDELEKADPDVLNLFLQVLEDGRLTENTGRTVSFANTVIVATSNAGSGEIAASLSSGADSSQLEARILQLLQQSFKPELLNRFDAVIPYRSLSQPDLEQIAVNMLREVRERAAAKQVSLTIDPDAIQKLISLGYDPTYGARPLRRVIEERVESIIADQLLRQEVQPGGVVHITAAMVQ